MILKEYETYGSKGEKRSSFGQVQKILGTPWKMNYKQKCHK
jgi:hypothetical protein